MVEETDETSKSEVVMLQTGPSFFAFEPVLAALKTAPIPLDDIIAQPPPKVGQSRRYHVLLSCILDRNEVQPGRRWQYLRMQKMAGHLISDSSSKTKMICLHGFSASNSFPWKTLPLV